MSVPKQNTKHHAQDRSNKTSIVTNSLKLTLLAFSGVRPVSGTWLFTGLASGLAPEVILTLSSMHTLSHMPTGRALYTPLAVLRKDRFTLGLAALWRRRLGWAERASEEDGGAEEVEEEVLLLCCDQWGVVVFVLSAPGVCEL